MEILERLSEELGIKLSQIEAAVALLDEGNTTFTLLRMIWVELLVSRAELQKLSEP